MQHLESVYYRFDDDFEFSVTYCGVEYYIKISFEEVDGDYENDEDIEWHVSNVGTNIEYVLEDKKNDEDEI